VQSIETALFGGRFAVIALDLPGLPTALHERYHRVGRLFRDAAAMVPAARRAAWPTWVYIQNDRDVATANQAFLASIRVTRLERSGTPAPGKTVDLILTSTGDGGKPYQLASSLGRDRFPASSLPLDLNVDGLLAASLRPEGRWVAVFEGFRGTLDADGRARAAIHLPESRSLVGLPIHTAFMVREPDTGRIEATSNTVSFVIASPEGTPGGRDPGRGR
jgi:hypothetical protein